MIGYIIGYIVSDELRSPVVIAGATGSGEICYSGGEVGVCEAWPFRVVTLCPSDPAPFAEPDPNCGVRPRGVAVRRPPVPMQRSTLRSTLPRREREAG